MFCDYKPSLQTSDTIGGIRLLVFTWSNGPLLWAIVIWRSGLVFHSLSHITTIYIHLLPALVTFVIRWIPSEEQSVSDLCSGQDCILTLSDVFQWPILLYLLWQGLYLIKTEVLDRKKLQADKDIGTSLRHLIAFYENHFFGRVANCLGPQRCFILVILTISIWNGAGFYVYKVNKNIDAAEAPPGSPQPSTEAWFQRYIRRGSGESAGGSPSSTPTSAAALSSGVVGSRLRRPSSLGKRGITIDGVFQDSGTDSEAAGGRKKQESKKRK
ncbi:UNVERIFIED_CONTAM: hypothetical protein HDU68_008186 [Siphonaria sp. JEL0065]|nr:hypothetical protein HDU68_008186 [Siphonaria sp. JEL0065]